MWLPCTSNMPHASLDAPLTSGAAGPIPRLRNRLIGKTVARGNRRIEPFYQSSVVATWMLQRERDREWLLVACNELMGMAWTNVAISKERQRQFCDYNPAMKFVFKGRFSIHSAATRPMDDAAPV